MRKLLNTLYVSSKNAYLSLDGENIVVNKDKQIVARFPLHTLESIISFSYSGASPALMGECAKRGINLAFCTPRGRFLARVSGNSIGNVLLRRTQYRIADDENAKTKIAQNFIFGKVCNCRRSLERTKRDHAMRIDVKKLEDASAKLKDSAGQLLENIDDSTLRGIEGFTAKCYFNVFDMLILNNKDTFSFTTRSRRPPLDPLNALLSFAYSLLANDCASALEAVGLDSYVGFMHTDRPGRASLALDLMEELRPCMADRFVITMINNRQLNKKDFQIKENGSVLMTDDARTIFLRSWQERKQETIVHPFLKEKIPWGLLPYIQAQLLSSHIRGDLDEYPPFLWK